MSNKISKAAREHLLRCIAAMKQAKASEIQRAAEEPARRTVTYAVGNTQVHAESTSDGKRAHVSFTFRNMSPPAPPDEEHVVVNAIVPGQVRQLLSSSGERRRGVVVGVASGRAHVHVYMWGGMFCVDTQVGSLVSQSLPVGVC